MRWSGLIVLMLGMSLATHANAAGNHRSKQARPTAKHKHKATRAKTAGAPRAAHVARTAGRAMPALSASTDSNGVGLRSSVALVIDDSTGRTMVSKNINDVHPIASITKLMTALVVLDGNQALSRRIAITEEDVDTERGSRSRLRVGAEFTRSEVLHLALMASEKRAAHALGRSQPGGLAAFVESMNARARDLGMERTRFVDPTGLSSSNVSTAADLAKLVQAAHNVNLIRQYSTDTAHEVNVLGREVRFHNTNRLVAANGWDIGLSKTGYINEAGRCLVMRAKVDGRPLTFVLLDSAGKLSRIGDANRIRKWLSTSAAYKLATQPDQPIKLAEERRARGHPALQDQL